MTYDQMLAFLSSRLNYERKGMPAQQDLRLDRVAMLLDALGNPQRSFPVVHIAGTKGKGSTATMVAALLQHAGYKVGLHVSPHLHRLEERFQVNRCSAVDTQIAQLVEELVPIIDAVDLALHPDQPPLTFFEITTALTLLYFARQAVDWAVVEVGMGGRLDSTNVLVPEAAVITSISRDHTRQLGDQLEQIAAEKAGIVKTGRPLISGAVDHSVCQVIASACRSKGSRLIQRGEDFDCRYESLGIEGGIVHIQTWKRQWPPLRLTALGEHQGANAAIAAAVIDALSERGQDLEASRLAAALESVRLPGRIEIVARNPTVVVDVAHNVASVQVFSKTLKSMFGSPGPLSGRRILVFGSSHDKEWREMLESIYRDFDELVVTNYLSNPRSLPAEEIAGFARHLPISMSVSRSPAEAWHIAQTLANDDKCTNSPRLATPGQPDSQSDCIVCVTGSFYLAAEFRELLRTTGSADLCSVSTAAR